VWTIGRPVAEKRVAMIPAMIHSRVCAKLSVILEVGRWTCRMQFDFGLLLTLSLVTLTGFPGCIVEAVLKVI
jgi:hypothetical protein